MKITCIIHSLHGGGAERVMASLASRLAQRDHRVTLITLDDGSRDRHELDPAVVRRTLNVMSNGGHLLARLRNTRNRIRSLRAAIVQTDPDVVLSFCDSTNILTLLAARALAVPVVISERSDPSKQNLGNFWEWIRGRTYRRAKKIIALTPESAEHLRAVSGQEVQVIASAVDSPPEGLGTNTPKCNHRILAVGRLEHEKGVDRLLRAFALAAKQNPDWTLRILGDGSLRESLERQAHELVLADRVTFPGWVDDVWQELSEASLFVLPSRYEGFPSALLEAMAAGVPSIAVDCESGPRMIIHDSHSGLLVENSEQALADGIKWMMDDENRREKMGIAGKRVVERFGWTAMTSAYETVLSAAIES